MRTPRRILALTVAVLTAATTLFGISAAEAAEYPYHNGQIISADQARAWLLDEVNEARAAAGLAPLALAPSHAGADCNTATSAANWQLVHWSQCLTGNYRGEIIAMAGSSSPLVPRFADQWMNSTGHRNIMLEPGLQVAEVSIGCSYRPPSQGYSYAVWGSVQPYRYDRTWPGTQSRSAPGPTFDTGVGPSCNSSNQFVWVDPSRPGPGTGGNTTGTDGLDPNAPQSWYRFQVARLYTAYFGRYPDASGWSYWNARHRAGVGLSAMSSSFADSAEFRTVYGNAVSNQAFVELVYRNVLNRPSDTEGIAYWLGQMRRGMSRGDLMIYFSESSEFVRLAGPTVTGSCWNGDPVTSYRCATTSAAG